MSWLTDLFKTPDKVSTQTTTKDPWVTSASQTLTSKATDLANRPFEAYSGELTAGLTKDQQDAFSKIRDLISNSPNLLSKNLSSLDAFSGAPAQSVSYADTSKINADTAALMNPNVAASLKPMLDQIQKSYDDAQKKVGAAATSAGAFGDARQGILEAENLKNKASADTNAVGTAYNNAFQQAQGTAQNLAQGQFQAGTTNANLTEQALQRLLTGTNAEQTVAGSDQSRVLQAIQSLLSGGTLQQQTNQAGDTAAYNEFLRGQGWDYNTLKALSDALGAANSASNTTKTETAQGQSGSSGIAGVLGSVASKALPAVLGALI